ncbi:MAG: sn-glycerol-3-phosphate ABC transporter ATP-binding protein UgpC [Sphaerochaetaceae bacterium]|nr:sn-glycerol-3-phosphate ABC transporter ATP-binding protein UgpC [Sphaerochaetaceae bacterium]
MASVSLKNIKKIYPPVAGERKKHQASSDGHNANLEKTERGVVAVQDFSIEIRDKEFVVLVGPSGCGKSTTLRMIAGLEEITEGQLYIDGKLVNELYPKDRDIAMVFQNYALYPHMTVYDNMAFALKKRTSSKEEIDKKVKEAAVILGITDYLDRKPKSLSGGQRQRVAIGRAIVRNPKCMLMDEPLSNLDAKLRNQMRAELIRLRKKIDTTFIYVTHDQTEAMTLGDRIVVMKDGFVQQIGTPKEVFDKPSNQFVAGFIGTPQMNFFQADLKEEHGQFSVDLDGFTIPVVHEDNSRMKANNIASGPIILGLRPDSLFLVESKDCPVANVGVVEMMGTNVHLHLEYNGKDLILVTQAKDEHQHLKMDYESDSEIHFSFLPQSMYLFDIETGKNLAI